MILLNLDNRVQHDTGIKQRTNVVRAGSNITGNIGTDRKIASTVIVTTTTTAIVVAG